MSLTGAMSNVYTKDLIVCDEEYQSTSPYKAVGAGLERCLDAYVKILQQLSANSGGQLAENLGVFAQLTQALMGDTISDISSSWASMMGDYVRQIDYADSKLY